jgi:hypothetical protein
MRHHTQDIDARPPEMEADGTGGVYRVSHVVSGDAVDDLRQRRAGPLPFCRSTCPRGALTSTRRIAWGSRSSPAGARRSTGCSSVSMRRPGACFERVKAIAE